MRSLVGLLGARPVIMTPDDHDRAIARVSHLPQLLSTVLANFTDVKDAEIAGSGLRDMLRLAGSSYSVWKGIFETNPDNIESALEDFVRHLQAAGVASETAASRHISRMLRPVTESSIDPNPDTPGRAR